MTNYGMKLADYDYVLPEHFIAQTPTEPRDACKLMTVNRKNGELSHRVFRDIIDFLNP
ncbi:S-adenosylmethionine:tRNA ribosyltransferase-isomerase [bacterium]|nr:S-adenosylmethionine:tRNA ribosyltransferase-isomerase [bacterium]